MVQIAPYGSWKSPITTDLIVAGSIGISGVSLDGENIYWVEMRPSEGGRNVVVRRLPDGSTTDLTPKPFNVRTRVHEYGGGALLVHNGTLYFSNFADQRLYRQQPGGEPEPISPAVDLRYADAVFDEKRGRLLCVREDHTIEGQEATNTIVSVDPANPDGGVVLVSGNNFYSTPRLSPDGSKLVWLTWNHPNMPWDGCELWMAEVEESGSLTNHRLIAGGLTESVFQPEWSPEGVLHFVSDRTGWWNLYRLKDGEAEALCQLEAEFAHPQWVFKMSTYGFTGDGQLIASYTKNGFWHLAKIENGQAIDYEIPLTDIDGVGVKGNRVVVLGGSASLPVVLATVDATSGKFVILKRTSSLEIEPGYISTPQEVEYPTENGLTAHGFYYPPANKDFQAPEGEAPPLLVKIHGGPTSATSGVLSASFLYWTSRGFAILDVNYGGSTGYGRAYRERLNGQWGIVDVDDCVNGALYLVKQGLADGNRLAIDGGSAGGYTTLAVLTFRDVFKAGASYFGVSDLEALARDTHKFESRYLDNLVGPYPAETDLYHQRSPIYFTDHLRCPLILFQGLEDMVVPPSQAEMMYDAVLRKGIPVAYIPYEGEQHGFRKAENIKRSLEAEFYFYAKVFGFTPADTIDPVEIANLP